MSDFGVYEDEMQRFLKSGEVDFDRLFSGKNPAGDSGVEELAAFVSDVKQAYFRPLDSKAEASNLAAMMKAVALETEKGEPAARPASKATGSEKQTSGLPKWKRRKTVLAELFGTLAAKVAMGAVVAAAATGGLAAADKLPAPMQNGVAVAIEAITPFEIPSSDDLKEEAKKNAETGLELEKVEGDTQTPGAGAQNEFGQRVSEDAKNGGVDGSVISDEARQIGEQRRQDAGRRPETIPPAGGSSDSGQDVPAAPPADAGSQSSAGLGQAEGQGGNVPSEVPAGPGTAGQYRP